MAKTALSRPEYEDIQHRIQIGSDPKLYSQLLPLSLAFEGNCVVIDIFEGDAIIASPSELSEDILDALFLKGLGALHLRCSNQQLARWQAEILSHQTAIDAEIIGQSKSGVINWMTKPIIQRAIKLLSPIVILLYLAVIVPSLLLVFGTALLAFTLVMRLSLCSRDLPHAPSVSMVPDQLPIISILVPLYKEAEILPKLIRRLEQIDYPTDRLDILLLFEEKDWQSQIAWKRQKPPDHIQSLTVPKRSIQTKPRAMNTALPFLRGAIVGVYDAEDAPHPKQVLTVAGAFAASAQTACVQAPLDIYNTDQSWLSACFTVEYATLFRRQNPSLAAKNWPLPLGGTSFFIRKDVLKSLGGWDAFNVTEDADLGLRLHQAGYQTKMIAPPTLEEAPTDIAAWVKQRSRWLKGFLLTWMTTRKDSRSVLAAYLLLGPIVAAVTGVLTVPLWIMTLGFEVIEPTGAFYAFTAIAIMSEISLAAIGWLALRAKSHRHLRWVLPLMPVYRLLLIPAAIKAVIEAVFAPVFWDKTRHGQSG